MTIEQLESRIKLPYTFREILELEYTDFWNAATECVRVLRELQNLSSEILTLYKGNLPDIFHDMLNSKPSQVVYLNYIKLRSIYCLNYTISQILDSQCRNLAKAGNSNNSIGVDIAKRELVDIMSLVENMSNSLDIFSDDNGFFELEQLINGYRPRLDFGVFDKYSYRDIVTIIRKSGFQCEGLWVAVKADNPPLVSNILGIMEMPGDNEMVRIY